MRLIITRPAEDAGPLKSKLEGMGHSVVIAPLLRIVARPGVQVAKKNYQLICATSANAVKHACVSQTLKELPVFTVGPQSLAAARAAGFTRAEARGGDVHGLAAHIIATFGPAIGPVLYLAGAETSSDLRNILATSGFQVDKVIVYDAVIQAPEGIAHDVAGADGVLLYSPRSARIWVDLTAKPELETAAAKPIYFCLSDNVARVLPSNWQKRVAKTPDEAAMLALLD
jgi:uroporphyrinogen-III synthase